MNLAAAMQVSSELRAKQFTEERRQSLAKKGFAKPDGSYPIENEMDVKNAVADFHRSSGSPSDKSHIRTRAKALGMGDPFPGEKEKIAAGGPGSGRRPGGPTAMSPEAQHGLNIMHDGMAKNGFKYNTSTPSETTKGAMFHDYKDSKNATSAGIREHADGKFEFMQK